MKRYITLLAVLLALVTMVPTGITAQSAPTPVFAAVSDDTGIAMLVRYVGSANSATVAVDAGTGDLTFQVSAAAYTGFECPVSGALGGIIDVSDVACDTMGEVVDIINASGSDFRAVLIDSLRTDVSTDAIVTIGATQVTRRDGLQLNIDTSVALLDSRALVPNRTDISGYLGGPPNYPLLQNPYAWGPGRQPFLRWYEAKSTYGSGTSLAYVYSVKPVNKASGSEVVTTLWGPEAGGATTVTKQFSYWQTNNLPGRQNEKLIVRLVNSAAMASTAGFASGEIR